MEYSGFCMKMGFSAGLNYFQFGDGTFLKPFHSCPGSLLERGHDRCSSYISDQWRNNISLNEIDCSY